MKKVEQWFRNVWDVYGILFNVNVNNQHAVCQTLSQQHLPPQKLKVIIITGYLKNSCQYWYPQIKVVWCGRSASSGCIRLSSSANMSRRKVWQLNWCVHDEWWTDVFIKFFVTWFPTYTTWSNALAEGLKLEEHTMSLVYRFVHFWVQPPAHSVYSTRSIKDL